MSLPISEVEKRIKLCKSKINDALCDAGRIDEVTLIGAVKTRSKEFIKEVVDKGLLQDIGDNRVQELIANYNSNLNVKRHFIGRLQTNKVKYIIDKVSLIHSLDREELAAEIDKQAAKHGLAADCLIAVNVGSELSKGGVEMSEVLSFANELKKYSNIRLRGLMSVMPMSVEKDKLIDLYKRFYDKFLQLKQLDGSIDTLSCGMSGDYEIAVRYGGSTAVRLGRIIFGERE